MLPGKMTCPYRPAASAIANAIPGFPCPAPWVHHDAHASTNARCDTRTCDDCQQVNTLHMTASKRSTDA